MPTTLPPSCGEPNTGVAGNDLVGEYSNVSACDCEKYCNNNEFCKGWHHFTNGGKCWLKGSDAKLEYNSNGVGALKPSTTTTPFETTTTPFETTTSSPQMTSTSPQNMATPLGFDFSDPSELRVLGTNNFNTSSDLQFRINGNVTDTQLKVMEDNFKVEQ